VAAPSIGLTIPITGKSLADILSMTAGIAPTFEKVRDNFASEPRIFDGAGVDRSSGGVGRESAVRPDPEAAQLSSPDRRAARQHVERGSWAERYDRSKAAWEWFEWNR